MPLGKADRRGTRRAPNILVAHGDPPTRDGVAGILSRAGYNVDEAPDHDQTLKMLSEGEIDVLVVSLRLPPNGYVKLLNSCYDAPPTIVLGELSDTHMRSAIDDRRVVSVLPTPYKIKDLYDAVETAAARHGRD